VSTFRRTTLTEPTEHPGDGEAWELTLDDEDNPERSLVELLAVRITVHVEILDNEAAAFAESGKWSREQHGAELAQDDAMRCLALIVRRQPDALRGKRIGDLLGDAIVEAASEADPDDPEFAAEYADECGRAASRIMRVIVTHLEAERRP
jgi:transcriptional regulator of met regulon